MFLKSNKMLFQKIFRNFERKNNRLLVYTMSLYSLLAILSISSSITLLSSYSREQQEEYSLIREWGSKGFDHGTILSARRCSNRFKRECIRNRYHSWVLKQFKNSIRMELLSLVGEQLGYGQGSFVCASDIATDAQDNVYVVDTNNPNQAVQKFTNNGTFITSWGSQGFGDGQFINPIGISNRFKR